MCILVDGKDINYNSIVSSNPFKETWVTSPLTKYGRLVKTGNQATGINIILNFSALLLTVFLKPLILSFCSNF